MKKEILILFLFLSLTYTSFSQNLYASYSYGLMYSSINNSDLQTSYSSYIQSMQPILDQNGLAFTQVDENFSPTQVHGVWSFQVGMGAEGLSLVFSALNSNTSQVRNVFWSNGFGRSFEWKETRRETVLDLGLFGTKKLDFYGSFGVNWNWSRMVSYQIYPDGTRTLTNEAGYNGVYKKYTTGLSFGAGVRYRFKNYVALEARYLYSKIGIGSKKEDDFGFSDNSMSKNPTISYFPQDFTGTIAVDAGNELVPYFNRHSVTLSAIFYLNLTELKKKNKQKK